MIGENKENKDNTAYERTILYKNIYTQQKMLYTMRTSVAKEARYLLWKQCEELSMELLMGVIPLTSVGDEERLRQLAALDLKNEQLKVVIRLTYELKVIDSKKLVAIAQCIVDTGRMIGGWMKHIQKKDKRPARSA
jgi:hypothetical protein